MTFPVDPQRFAAVRADGWRGDGMLRAAAWTVSLFGAGAGICHVFPSTWIEPTVLIGLGGAFLFVSARTGLRPRRARLAAPKQVAA